jgi:drug/metabolite transporter (DMT)-like permease
MAIETLTRKETIIQEAELPKQSHQRNLGLDALLILITIIWGSTFLIVKNTEKLTGPFTFLALCYGTGTILLACIFHKRLAHITRSELIKGSGIGTLLFTAYALQYIGLQSTLTSKAGFITGLYVPFVVIAALERIAEAESMLRAAQEAAHAQWL